MDPKENSQEPETEAGVELNGHQETFHQAPQRKVAAQPPHSAATQKRNTQDSSQQVLEGRNELTQSSGRARHTIARDQEASHRSVQSKHAANLPNLHTSQVQDGYQEEQNFGPRELRRALSTPVSETYYDPTSIPQQYSKQQHMNIEQKLSDLQLKNEQLAHQMQKDKATMISLQASLTESKAEKEILQQRLEEASNTIFRLRPQRKDCTETEIGDDYERLIKLVNNWVNINCESFLDDNLHLFDIPNHRRPASAENLEVFELIALQFLSQPNRWDNAREHFLVAVIMRYLFDRILNQAFSVFLVPKERNFLSSIEMGMDNTELQKDLLTIRTWRSDTITAIDSHKSFKKRRPSIEKSLTSGLYKFLRGALSNEESQSIMMSMFKDVIAPALALAHKTQSASTIWSFRYSTYVQYKPGEFASRLPSFLKDIQNFRCINLSNSDRLLKPVNDLSTREKNESLVYVSDICPGLYCQRVTAGDDSQLVSTISQPILLVEFAGENTHVHTQQRPSASANHENMNPNRKPSSSGPVSTTRAMFDTVKARFGSS